MQALRFIRRLVPFAAVVLVSGCGSSSGESTATTSSTPATGTTTTGTTTAPVAAAFGSTLAVRVAPCLQAGGAKVREVELLEVPQGARKKVLDPFSMRLSSGKGGKVLFLPFASGPEARAYLSQSKRTISAKRRRFTQGRMVVLFDDDRNDDITRLVFRCVKTALPKKTK